MNISLLFLGIFFVVGVDVGTNIVAPKMLIERCAYAVQDAGAFIGTLFLTRISGVTYFRINIIAAIASIVLLFSAGSAPLIMCAVGLIGFFCSSIFSIIYSEALKTNPEKGNEISGLMIMGVFGGAVIPPAMGLCADAIGNQCGSLIIISACLLYLGYCALRLKAKA